MNNRESLYFSIFLSLYLSLRQVQYVPAKEELVYTRIHMYMYQCAYTVHIVLVVVYLTHAIGRRY